MGCMVSGSVVSPARRGGVASDGHTMDVWPPFVKGDAVTPRKQRVNKALAAERLRLALAKKGWKAAELARRLDVSRQLAASWTRGEALPSGIPALQLPALLGVDVAWLFPTGVPTPGKRARMPQDARSGATSSAGAPRQPSLTATPPSGEGWGATGLPVPLTSDQMQRLHAAGAALESALEENEMYGDDRRELIEVLENIQQFLKAKGKAEGDLGLVIDTLKRGYL